MLSFNQEILDDLFEIDDINVTSYCYIPLKYEIKIMSPIKGAVVYPTLYKN
jgi:hypothetical protein